MSIIFQKFAHRSSSSGTKSPITSGSRQPRSHICAALNCGLVLVFMYSMFLQIVSVEVGKYSAKVYTLMLKSLPALNYLAYVTYYIYVSTGAIPTYTVYS